MEKMVDLSMIKENEWPRSEIIISEQYFKMGVRRLSLNTYIYM